MFSRSQQPLKFWSKHGIMVMIIKIVYDFYLVNSKTEVPVYSIQFVHSIINIKIIDLINFNIFLHTLKL